MQCICDQRISCPPFADSLQVHFIAEAEGWGKRKIFKHLEGCRNRNAMRYPVFQLVQCLLPEQERIFCLDKVLKISRIADSNFLKPGRGSLLQFFLERIECAYTKAH